MVTAWRGVLGGLYTEAYPTFAAPHPVNLAAALLAALAVIVDEIDREAGPRWRLMGAAPLLAAAFYLPIVDGWRPRRPLWKTPLEVYGWSLVYLAIAMTANKLLGTNFAFASHKPENPSLLDHLGPWPQYLCAMQVIAVALFYLLLLPFVRRPGK